MLGLRRRLLLSVVGAVALALVVLIGAFNLVLRARLSHEADNALYARASAELATLQVKGDQLLTPEAPDAGAPDAQTWVFSGASMIEYPRSDALTQHTAELLSRGPRRTQDLGQTHTRLYAVPVLNGSRRVGAVIAEVSLTPYENSANTALIASVVLGAVLLLLVAIAARALIAGALRPVAHMTGQAREWSDADTGMRFGLGPPRDELTQLAATLDDLLDRVANSIRHEQRFSAELSHELRTPLTTVITEAQLALRHPRTEQQYRDGYQRVLDSARQMHRTLDTLLTAARVEVGRARGTGDASAAARAAAQLSSGAVTVLEPETPIGLGVDTDVAERVLAPLVENAERHAVRSVTITVGRSDGAALFTVADDGPGVAEDDRERIFDPGFGRDGGAGLGLPLARRLARAAGGDITLEHSPGGARFTVSLPAA